MSIKGVSDSQLYTELVNNGTELNDLLSEFYHQNATFTNAEEWMDRNEYHNSTADEDIEKWKLQ